MEEAEALANWIGILHEGTLIADDSPLRLRSKHGDGLNIRIIKNQHVNKESIESKMFGNSHVVKTVFESTKELLYSCDNKRDWVSELAEKLSSLDTNHVE